MIDRLPNQLRVLSVGALSMLLMGSVAAGWLVTKLEPMLLLYAGAALVAALLAGGVVLFRYSLQFALGFVIAAVTVHGTRFGIAVKLDGVAVLLLGLVLLVTVPLRFVALWRYPLWLPAIGYLAANFAASLLVSPIQDISLRQSMVLVGRVLTFFFVALAVQLLPELRRRWPQRLLVLLLVHTILGMAGLVLYPFVQTPFVAYGQDGGSSLAINGFFLEPNLYAGFALSVIALYIPITLFGDRPQRFWRFMALTIGLTGLLLSYTRSSWLGFVFVVGCLTVFMMTRPSTKARPLYSILLIVLGFAGFVLLDGVAILSLLGIDTPLLRRLNAIVDPSTTSSAVRINLWWFALEQWQNHKWLGSGPLSIGVLTGYEGWLYSSIMQTLHDSGILGTLSMLWLCFGAMIYTWRAYYVATDDWDRGASLGFLLAQIGLFFTSQFSSFLWGGFSWALFGLAVGHSMTVLRPARSRSELAILES